MANATYEFMRANATEEMRRVLGAKAANVQLAVPPTLATGDWSVDTAVARETARGAVAICMMACRDPTTTSNHDEWFECENVAHLRQAIK